jgi:elongation factor P hydroxylase
MNSEQQLAAMLVPFYLGEQPDAEGRMIQEIWAWDFEALELVHNYIQWLFPIAEKSAFNADAPVLNADIIQAFQNHPQLRQHLLRSFTVLLRFYGLQYDHSAEQSVSRLPDYPHRRTEWIQRFDHNYLRITRILKCLMTLGLAEEARSFYQCLQEIYREERDRIGGETFQYWTDAVERSRNS